MGREITTPHTTDANTEATRQWPQTSRHSKNWLRWPKQKQHQIIIIVIAVVIVISLFLWWHAAHNQAPVTQPASTVSAEFKKQLPALKKTAEHSKNPEDHKNYAIALYATGDPKAASKEYETAVKLNPKDALAYNNLGNAYRDLHQTDKAIDAYRTSIKLNSKSINTYANLANVQLYTQNKPEDAIATYQEGLKALPNNSQLQLLLGLAYEQAGDTTQAKQIYQTILAHDSTNAAAKANLDRLNGR
jgi:tetratricopeptide (TPR) repeat protein